LESEKIHSSLLALRERFFERFQSGCLAIGLAFVLHGYPRRVRLSYDECVMSKVKVAIHIEVRYHLVHCVRLRRLCHFPKDDVFDKEVVSLFLLPEWGENIRSMRRPAVLKFVYTEHLIFSLGEDRIIKDFFTFGRFFSECTRS
jgi:hypothetical protein